MSAELKNAFLCALRELRKQRQLFNAFSSGKEKTKEKVRAEEEKLIAALMPFVEEAIQIYNRLPGTDFLIVGFEVELKTLSVLSNPVDGILILVKKFLDKKGEEPTVETFTDLVLNDGLHKRINESFRPILKDMFDRWGINVPLVELSTLHYFKDDGHAGF